MRAVGKEENAHGHGAICLLIVNKQQNSALDADRFMILIHYYRVFVDDHQIMSTHN